MSYRYRHLHSLLRQQQYQNFHLKRVQAIPELDLTAYELQHRATGAIYLHLSSQDNNNAFRTPAWNSNGAAHILEHVVLCGSKKYPIRDPFFKMVSRSLATYMNAWTAADHTMYPFATTSTADYRNLRDIYCDAVFNPVLNRQDFRQEGWRLEYEQNRLLLKGVVFNEMKGAMSDLESLFVTRMQQHMFEGSIYGHSSGGEPLSIPDLTHDQLVSFHRSHYSPSNCLFFSYGMFLRPHTLGNLDLQDNLTYLNGLLESRQWPELPPINLNVDGVSRPKVVTEFGPIDPIGDPSRQIKMSLGFFANSTDDPQEIFHMKLLSFLLLSGSSSPMHQALVASNIGLEYSAGTGYDPSTCKATFSIGLQGIKGKDVDLVATAIKNVLEECASTGFEPKRIEAALHLAEIGIKFRSADAGIGLAASCTQSWTHHSDLLNHLMFSNRVKIFKEELSKGGLFEGLVKKYLLKTPDIIFTMKPDLEYNEKLQMLEDQKIKTFVNIDLEALEKDNKELKTVQDKKVNLDVLPCLSINDVSRLAKKSSVVPVRDKLFWRQAQHANGLLFLKALFPIKQRINSDEILYLPLLCDALTEIGVPHKSIELFDQDVKLYTGGISVSPFVGRMPKELDQPPELALCLSSHALEHNVSRMCDLIAESMTKANFKNLGRLKTILSAKSTDMTNSVVSSGHQIAMSIASSGFADNKHLAEITGGLTQARFLERLCLSNDMEELSVKLESLSKRIMSDSRIAVVSQKPFDAQEALLFDKMTRSICSCQSLNLELNLTSKTNSIFKTFISAPCNTNFVARCFRIDSYDCQLSANVSVLSRLLKSKYLHGEIREKNGAYGGGAAYSSLDGILCLYSYRDPNPAATIGIFEDTRNWLGGSSFTEQDLTEAKLSVFADSDRPVDVPLEGMHLFVYGLSDEARQKFRDEVFRVDIESLKEAGLMLLQTEHYTAILGQAGKEEQFKDMGFDIDRLND